MDYNESTAVRIQMDGSSVSCDSNAVQISGTTITILDEGTYILSGTLDDGMVIVNAEKTDKTQIVLENVSIHSETSAPIYILQADKVFLTMAEGSVNSLSSGNSFVPIDENNIDAAIFSKEDLTMNGDGTLTITSPAGHGVVSKDELILTSGTYEINSASHALAGKDSVCIANAALTLASGKDGIHAENSDDAEMGYVYIESGTFTIASEGDGISASSHLQIQEGTFDISTGGGSVNAERQTSDNWGMFMGGKGGRNADAFFQADSAEPSEDRDSISIKGIKAGGDLVINGGSFLCDAADDAVHSNSSLTVNDGTFEISTGDDGFHADETLTITGGTIHISQSYEGLEGLNVQVLSGTISLYADDDGINAAGGNDQSGMGGFRGGDLFASSSDCTINIAGGTLYLNAGGDGLDSNGTLTISGGEVVVSGPNSGDTAILDYSSSGVITGGTFIGTGMAGMGVNFSSSSTQGAIMINTGTQSTGTLVCLTDAEGNTLLSRETDQEFSSVVLSHPKLVQGETYLLTVGESTTEITLDSLVYGAAGTGGMAGGKSFGSQSGGRGSFGGQDFSGGMPFAEGETPPEDAVDPGVGSDMKRPNRGEKFAEIPSDQKE